MSARTTDLQNTIDGIGNAFETFQAKHNTVMADIKTAQLELTERIEELEARRSSPGKTAADRESQDHVPLFQKWISKPHDATTRQELENIQNHLSRKDMSIATPSAGGYSVPHELAFAFNSNTARVIHQLKDQQNRPLWVDSLQAGTPNRLLGYPVHILERMPDVDVSGGSNSTFAVAFGDFSRGYLWVDRVGIRIVVDQVTTLGKTRFWVSRRVGGCPLNNDAVKFLKTAA